MDVKHHVYLLTFVHSAQNGSGEISGLVQSLACESHPSIWWPCLIVLNAWLSKASAFALCHWLPVQTFCRRLWLGDQGCRLPFTQDIKLSLHSYSQSVQTFCRCLWLHFVAPLSDCGLTKWWDCDFLCVVGGFSSFFFSDASKCPHHSTLGTV